MERRVRGWAARAAHRVRHTLHTHIAVSWQLLLATPPARGRPMQLLVTAKHVWCCCCTAANGPLARQPACCTHCSACPLLEWHTPRATAPHCCTPCWVTGCGAIASFMGRHTQLLPGCLAAGRVAASPASSALHRLRTQHPQHACVHAPAHAAIDTLGPAPAGLNAEAAVALVAVKVLLALDLLPALDKWLHHLAESSACTQPQAEGQHAGERQRWGRGSGAMVLTGRCCGVLLCRRRGARQLYT